MKHRPVRSLHQGLVFTLALGGLLFASREASANTVTQNTSWTISRGKSLPTYRVTAYGNSIFAGYYGSLSYVAKRASPYVQGEYAAKSWNSNVEVVRRTKSGAVASDIYNNKIVSEASYMQTASTRVVEFEMCGNDFLQARSTFSKQTGTCDYSPIATALANCTNYQQLAMQYISAHSTAGAKKMVMTVYYPGYDADNVQTSCTDSGTGGHINKQTMFLPYLAHSNWRACNFAAQNGFTCVDVFASMMGGDYDSNGDGLVDSDGLKWQTGETEAAYVTRISTTLRGTLRDANTHFVNSSTSYDYIQSDNTHPTYTGSTIYLGGYFGGTGTGSGAADYSDAQIVSGKNPVWNQFGHERMGWIHSLFNP